MIRSFESRVLEERAKLKVSTEELRKRVINSSYGPKTKEVLEQTVSYESTTAMGFASFDCPPVMDRGQGSLVYDIDGNEYIDCLTGMSVNNVGLCNPEVVEVIRDQAGKLIHYFDLPTSHRARLSKKLTEIAPGDFPKKVMYAVSGSEAIEAALRLVRWYTGKQFVLSFYGAYHGRTLGAMALTAGKGWMWSYYYPNLPADSGVAWFPYAYCYRCPYGKEYPSCDIQCVKAMEDLLESRESPFRIPSKNINNIAAVFVEPMQASSGYIIPPDEFLVRLKALCEKHDIVFVADEIQTGMGRSGKMWAVQHSGVCPDVMTVAKSIAGGLPMSLAIGRAEIMDSWGPGAQMGTFAAFPLACATANKVLEIMERDKLAEQARIKGRQFLEGLEELSKRHPLIGHVNGRGLFISMELVKDKSTKEPAADEAGRVQQVCMKRGAIFQRSGYYGNRLQFIPSLVITAEQINRVLSLLDEEIGKAEKALGLKR